MKEDKNNNSITKILLTGIIIICIALLWAALHDIINGEEDITAEIIGAVLSIAGIIFTSFRLRKTYISAGSETP